MDQSQTVGLFQALWPVVAIATVLLIMLAMRSREQSQDAAAPAIVAIADRSLPLAPSVRDVPELARSATVDLQRGQCNLAAERYRTARQQYPANTTVAWYEGLSWVCAGNGAAAQQALDAYIQAGGDPLDPDLLWSRAQASLLQGRTSQARERLVELRGIANLDMLQRVDAELDALRLASR